MILTIKIGSELNMLNYKNNLDKLLHYDNEKVLNAPCQQIQFPLSAEDISIMEDLMSYVKWSRDPQLNKGRAKHSAVGIAANQMGYSKQMFYIRFDYSSSNRDQIIKAEHAIINPTILNRSEMITYLPKGEGCLSVENNQNHPGIVPRNYKIEAKAYNFLTKKWQTYVLRGYEAIVFQHEYDHLQGKLYHHRINKDDPWHVDPEWQTVKN